MSAKNEKDNKKDDKKDVKKDIKKDAKKDGKKDPSKEQFSSYRSLLSMDNAVSKKVEMDKNSKGNKRSRSISPARGSKRSSSKSPRQEHKRVNYDIPDRSYGDLYCKACDSHMNSDTMWSLHLQGKRHLKNTRSAEPERRYNYLDEDPEAMSVINAEKSPIVGLQHVCEIQRQEQKTIYTCFICSTTVPSSLLLVDHLLGLKHRMAYLKEHDLERYTLIHDSNLRKGQVEPVVEECIAKHESEKGRGKMIVRKEKPKFSSVNSKKSVKDHQDYYPIQRSYERDSLSCKDSEWKRTSSKYSDRSGNYDYDDREMRYSDSSSSLDKYYRRTPDKVIEKITDKEQKYIKQESDRDELWYTNSTAPDDLPNDELPDKHYSLSTAATVKSRLPDVNDSRFGDLREFLEQKKAPSLDSNIPDEVLGIISALPTVSFFQLVLFKLDNMKIEDEVEIKFLDRVVNKATTLAVNIKSKMITPTLRMKFNESMSQIDIKSDIGGSSKDVQDILQMVGECKALSSLRTQNAPSPSQPYLTSQRDSLSSLRTENAHSASQPYSTSQSSSLSSLRTQNAHSASQPYSTSQSSSLSSLRTQNVPSTSQPYLISPSSSLNVHPQCPPAQTSLYNSTSYSVTATPHPPYGNPFPMRPEVIGASRTVSSVEQSTKFFQSLRPPAHNPVTYDTSYSSSYSSNPCSIPGLTLTEGNSPENHAFEVSSPFDQLQAKANSIFGITEWNISNRR